ncbi:MAG: type IX secretion system sortase PorU, partial [Flavobacteriaceae bacterium]|nr:type IX secretion system sortase PorU [Flavobacteriaceae bacterium]
RLISSRARNITYNSVYMSPVVRVNGQLRKVLSFSVNYKYATSRNSGSRSIITNSVLATGDWYKFQVEETGVYRVSKSFLDDMGMNTDGIDPRNIRIYGHGGKPLPLLNRLNNEFDLPENAIQVIGEEDGSFDSGDFILFYGVGVKGFDLENNTNLNPYSDEAYYYVTVADSPGLRVQPMLEPTGDPNINITQFHDYKFHEVDEFSPAKVGRRWFGNRFDIENEQSYEFNFPNIVSGAPMNVKVYAAAAAETITSMAVSINATSVDPLTFGIIADPVLLRTDFFDGDIPASGETVTVDLVYNNNGNPSSVGYLDYISVEALRQLAGAGSQMAFRNNDAATTSGIGEYQISNASQFSQIWDVTNTSFISAKANDESNAIISFKANLGEIREYVAINPNNYFQPIAAANPQVGNQDLKGTLFTNENGAFQDIDYIIITAPFLIQPALRLANHHKNLSGMNVKVITTDQVYEEFSSGKQDVSAIRNLVRYVYDNASSPDKRLKYLCLFGDTSIDYKNRLANNNNIVPTFHRLSSISTSASFMSDDFFGNLDPDEGTIGGDTLDENGSDLSDRDLLDVAVGRILADNVSLANTMVDKVINYASKVSYGNWRNNFVLVSDDVDIIWEYNRLEVVLDSIGDRISAEKPFINVKKIHTDAFQQETSAGGNRYPQVNEKVVNDIEVGALILNYFGHGGEDGLAKEFIYTQETARNLRNKNRYPCIVTVTCEFTKFDNPQRITAGELTFWNSEGGAISLITTTRSIGVRLGVDFNEILAEELFGFGQIIPVPPAEALRLSKNQIGVGDDDRRVIFYIGDPAMRLAFPKQSVRLTTLNGQPISTSTDTLQALSRVKMGGEVLDESGNVLTNYNGILEAKVFDKNVQRQTLGNDGVEQSNGELAILDFITLGEILFNGQATVTNGQFEFEFVVPRDTQIPVGNGKVSLYSEKDNELEDQTGFNLEIKVGGLNENAPEDNEGPLIQLFMNDESFISGGITNDSPLLIAKLEDENGINTSSGIGHDIVAILDGDETNPFVLNEYYQAEVDDFTRGRANYKLRNLEEGLHTLTLKAWDVYNNSSTAEIQFVVFGNDKLEIRRVLNYPNPFVNYTEFWFEHNRPSEMLDVQVQIFTVTGKVVKTINQVVVSEGSQSRAVVWDGLDDFGDKIGKGVYVYKLTVKSSLANQQVEKYEKLVIL